jgi:hypothetical protein
MLERARPSRTVRSQTMSCAYTQDFWGVAIPLSRLPSERTCTLGLKAAELFATIAGMGLAL